MINKEEFVQLVFDYQEWDKQVDEATRILGVPLFESPIIDFAHKSFSMCIYYTFDQEGIGIIDWWLYEKSFNPKLYMKDKDGKIIPTDNINDIWELVKNHRK